MFFSTPAGKSVIALTLTLPLALVACGKSDDADKDAVLTSTTTATKSSPKPSEKPSEPAPEEKPSEAPAPEAAPVEPPPAENPEPPTETLINPFAEGVPTAAPLTPVEGGQPASEEVKAQIRDLVGGIYTQPTQRDFVRYIPEHTCKLILDKQAAQLAAVDYNQVPDIPMKSLDPNWGQYQVAGVDEAKIDGEVASALVTIQTPNGPESNTMRFRNEGGTWKMCDS